MQALVLGAHYFHRLELNEEFVVLLGFGLFFSRGNKKGKERKGRSIILKKVLTAVHMYQSASLA